SGWEMMAKVRRVAAPVAASRGGRFWPWPATGAPAFSGDVVSSYMVPFSVPPGLADGVRPACRQGLPGLVGAPVPVAPPQVRPLPAGDTFGFLAPPAGDGGMVAGHQHLRDASALPLARTSVLRIFEQAVLEALFGGRGVVAQRSRQQPDAGLDQCHGGDLAALQHEVADAYFLEPPRLDD